MQADLDYLCALAEKVPLAMFPCSIETSASIAIFDTATTRIYISLPYASHDFVGVLEYSPRHRAVLRSFKLKTRN